MTLLARTLFTDEHAAFREAARKFFEREVVPHHREWEKAGVAPKSVWLKAGEQGLLCVNMPEEYGGLGLSILDSALILEEIAAEKAGIIGAPRGELVPVDTVAVIGRQLPEAMEVLLAQAVRADAAVARADSEFAVLSRQVAVGGQLLELQGLGGVYSDVFLPLHGEYQAQNAALALAAVEAFFGAGAQRQLDIDAVRAGFAAAASPGRLERMRSAPTVFIDAAHNPAGAAALADALTTEFDFHFLVGVLGVMADKDVTAMLAAFEPVFSQVVVTSNGSPRALDVDTLLLRAEEIFGPERVVRADTLPDAIETATALVEDSAVESDGFSGAGIVITGSVVTAGVARTLFGRDPQ